jgi:hypothetical protein
MATKAAGLFGSATRLQEAELANRKLWQGMYANAGSPYEKMGLALAQLGGTILGVDETGTAATEDKDLQAAISAAEQKYQVGTADFYKEIYSLIPAKYGESKDIALQRYLTLDKQEKETLNAAYESVDKRPDQYTALATPMVQDLITKAQANGFKPEEEQLPTTAAEIAKFGQTYKLTKDKNFVNLVGLTKTYEKSFAKEASKAEEQLLDVKGKKQGLVKGELDIARSRQLLADAPKDAAAADEFFRINNIDPTKPLEDQLTASMRAFGMPQMIAAQQKALQLTKNKTATTPPAGGGAGSPTQYKPTSQDLEAASWLQNNPKSPLAAGVRQKLKAKGMVTDGF